MNNYSLINLSKVLLRFFVVKSMLSALCTLEIMHASEHLFSPFSGGPFKGAA